MEVKLYYNFFLLSAFLPPELLPVSGPWTWRCATLARRSLAIGLRAGTRVGTPWHLWNFLKQTPKSCLIQNAHWEKFLSFCGILGLKITYKIANSNYILPFFPWVWLFWFVGKYLYKLFVIIECQKLFFLTWRLKSISILPCLYFCAFEHIRN